MKGININKRPIKRIIARHMAIVEAPEIKEVNDTVETKESTIEDNVNITEEPVTEEKKATKKTKKVAVKKEDNNEIEK